jgi:hypothetical protein
MKSYMTPALLSLLLAVGCADRGEKSAQNPEESTSPAVTQPAAESAAAAPGTEPGVAAPEGTAGARTTGGTRAERPRTPRRPAAPADEPRGSARTAAPAPESTPAPAARPRAPEFREVTVPEGTALPLELQTDLSSETAQVEEPVKARLKQAVVVNGVTALPEGSVVSGEVTSVERAGRVKGRSSLAFSFSRVQADNLSGSLRTNPLTYTGEASKGEDATKIGAGAVGGAIVGGILGGGKGATKGAAIGGAAGTGVVLATRGKDVKLESGADLAATLAAPFTVRVPVR